MKRASPRAVACVTLLLVSCGGDSARRVPERDGGSSGGTSSGGGGGRASGGAGGSPSPSSGGATSGGGADAGKGGTGGEGGTPTPDASAGGTSSLDSGADAACSLDASICLGVCAATPPQCVDGVLSCTGPGHEAVETTCDGFDNDCDGETDEGCATCTVPLTAIRANLANIWDIDFDAQCNAYLTTLVSGPDHTTVVPVSGSGVATYTGNANQNMTFGLVDPDPANHRVVVTYSCCESCNCQAKNGLTLLYTCDPEAGDCGCSGQTNCPGFLDAPFFATGTKDTSVTVGGATIATPTGVAAGPGNTYFVGNFDPESCSSAADCTPCDPDHPDVWCSATQPACCHGGTGPLGRIARFTLPDASAAPKFRIVSVIPGEQIVALGAASDGAVLAGTYAGAAAGNLYRIIPAGDRTLLASFGSTVYSVTENRKTLDLYVETLGSPKVHRLDRAGSPLALPSGVPADPAANGVLTYGPDGQLYRLGVSNGTSALAVYALE